jgi:hypothetical protein
MTELFTNVSFDAKLIAEMTWDIATIIKNPIEVAEFLSSVTEFYSNKLTEEEVDFLRFYFNMKLEMMKE